jgi:hypothetical protein
MPGAGAVRRPAHGRSWPGCGADAQGATRCGRRSPRSSPRHPRTRRRSGHPTRRPLRHAALAVAFSGRRTGAADRKNSPAGSRTGADQGRSHGGPGNPDAVVPAQDGASSGSDDRAATADTGHREFTGARDETPRSTGQEGGDAQGGLARRHAGAEGHGGLRRPQESPPATSQTCTCAHRRASPASSPRRVLKPAPRAVVAGSSFNGRPAGQERSPAPRLRPLGGGALCPPRSPRRLVPPG